MFSQLTCTITKTTMDNLTVKISLLNAGIAEEMRRVKLRKDVKFASLKEKIRELFPATDEENTQIMWKDEDGDLITFSTDDELAELISDIKNNVLYIFIQNKVQKENLKRPEPDSDTIMPPPAKKQLFATTPESVKKLRKQSLIDMFLSPNKEKTVEEDQSKNQDKYCPNAAARGIKVYTKNEIENAKGERQIFYKYHNNMAEELSQHEVYKKWKKQELHGIIETSWTLKKTELRKIAVEKLQSLEERTSAQSRLKSSTLQNNLERLDTAHSCVMETKGILQNIKEGEREKMENLLHKQLEALKDAQEALRKNIKKRQTEMVKHLTSLQATDFEEDFDNYRDFNNDMVDLIAACVKRK